MNILKHWSEVMNISYRDVPFGIVCQVEGTFTVLTLDEYCLLFCCGLVSTKH